MTKQRKSRVQSIPMTVGNDPSLWRYASLQEALSANTHLLSQMIQEGRKLNSATTEVSNASADIPEGTSE